MIDFKLITEYVRFGMNIVKSLYMTSVNY